MLPELRPGTLVQGRYLVAQRLGSGGMGAVYRAQDRRLGIQVALKETFRTGPTALAQFEREARLLAALKHPGLPRVSDYFAEQGRYYLVMEYVPGLNGEEWVARHGPMPEPQVRAWAGHLLHALSYLHHQRPPIIHRDVKPANVRVTPQGQAVLVDFGIAKQYDPTRGTTLGAKAISPGYSPPEQYTMTARTDVRSDIYGLGATLYFLLTGVVPSEAPARAAGATLPSPSHHARVSPELDRAVLRALALHPAARWQSMKEMYAALGAPASRPRPTPGPAAGGGGKRPPRPAATPPGAAPSRPAVAAARLAPARRGLALPLTIGIAAVGLIVLAALVVAAFLVLPGLGRETPTPTPTPTVTPSAMPTGTATPLPPTATPSFTEGAATVTPATDFSLLGPPDGAIVRPGNVTFDWKWIGELPEQFTFVITTEQGEICSSPEESCSSLLGVGVYEWWVELRGGPQIIRSDRRILRVVPPSTPTHTPVPTLPPTTQPPAPPPTHPPPTQPPPTQPPPTQPPPTQPPPTLPPPTEPPPTDVPTLVP